MPRDIESKRNRAIPTPDLGAPDLQALPTGPQTQYVQPNRHAARRLSDLRHLMETGQALQRQIQGIGQTKIAKDRKEKMELGAEVVALSGAADRNAFYQTDAGRQVRGGDPLVLLAAEQSLGVSEGQLAYTKVKSQMMGMDLTTMSPETMATTMNQMITAEVGPDATAGFKRGFASKSRDLATTLMGELIQQQMVQGDRKSLEGIQREFAGSFVLSRNNPAASLRDIEEDIFTQEHILGRETGEARRLAQESAIGVMLQDSMKGAGYSPDDVDRDIAFAYSFSAGTAEETQRLEGMRGTLKSNIRSMEKVKRDNDALAKEKLVEDIEFELFALSVGPRDQAKWQDASTRYLAAAGPVDGAKRLKQLDGSARLLTQASPSEQSMFEFKIANADIISLDGAIGAGWERMPPEIQQRALASIQSNRNTWAPIRQDIAKEGIRVFGDLAREFGAPDDITAKIDLSLNPQAGKAVAARRSVQLAFHGRISTPEMQAWAQKRDPRFDNEVRKAIQDGQDYFREMMGPQLQPDNAIEIQAWRTPRDLMNSRVAQHGRMATQEISRELEGMHRDDPRAVVAYEALQMLNTVATPNPIRLNPNIDDVSKAYSEDLNEYKH